MNIRSLVRMGICGLCVIGTASIGYAETAEDAAQTAEAASMTEQKIEQAEQALGQAEQKLEQAGQELGRTEEKLGQVQQAGEQVTELPTEPVEDPMAKWMQLASPNEHHAALQAFVGNWDVTSQYWMVPDMPGNTAVGTSEVTWILDGRYIVENYQTTGPGPDGSECVFKGMGITGYDNAKGEYVGTWMDNMSTAPVTSHGQLDNQILTMDCQFDCPIEGPTSTRMITKIISPDEIVMEAFKKPEGKDEYKCLVITYKRR